MAKTEDIKEIIQLLDNISEKEILKLRECCNDKDGFDNYIYNASDKIFRKLVPPYFRFEVLQNCILDVKNNSEYYTNIDNKSVSFLYNKLQKICVFLNMAVDEYSKLLSKIEHF